MPGVNNRYALTVLRPNGSMLARHNFLGCRGYLCFYFNKEGPRSRQRITRTRLLSGRTRSRTHFSISQSRRENSEIQNGAAKKVFDGQKGQPSKNVESNLDGFFFGAIAAVALSGFGFIAMLCCDKQRINAYDLFVGKPLSLLPFDRIISSEDEDIADKDQARKVLCQSPSLASNQVAPKIIFVGTGSSTGCPRPLCALLFPSEEDLEKDDVAAELFKLRKQYESSCKVSMLAVKGNNPKENKNYRNNPSILISHVNDDIHSPSPEETVSETWKRETQIQGGSHALKRAERISAGQLRQQNVIIDVGKTFREGALRWLPPNHIHSLDAIVLTHGHMDSIGGLDDVRGFQKRRTPAGSNIPAAVSTPGPKGGLAPMPVFLNKATMDAVERQFHYLVPSLSGPALTADLQKGGKSKITTVKPIQRLVAALDYNIIEDFEPFYAAGLKMTPLPVMHGEDMVCLGYAFSLKQPAMVENDSGDDATYQSKCINVVYLSDISRMLPETEKYIVNHLPPTDILILDSLLQEGHNATHQSMREAIDLAKRLGSEKVYLVGMNCDDFLPHDEMNDKLRNECTHEKVDIDVQLAHDGLVLDFKTFK